MQLTELKYNNVSILCTWANAFKFPFWNRKDCIISFDNEMLKRCFNNQTNKTIELEKGFFVEIKNNTIGWITGNKTIDENGVKWIEIILCYANRQSSGWVRLNDVNFENKNSLIWDIENIEIKKPNTKKILLGGGLLIGLFSIFK